jgi:tetratricopeptide (TPR) repeat protein
MPIVTGHYTLDLTELPVKAPDLRIRFALQLISHKNTLLVLYPNAEPGFEPSYVRYVAMMEFRHLLLRGREILVAQGRGQLVVTGQRLIGMITDGFAGKVALSESASSVFAFALDLDDIRPAQITEKNWRGEPIEAIIESKVDQSSVFGIKVFDYGEFLLLKDDGQVKRASLSAFLDQLTPESRRNLQVAPTVSEGEQISAHDPTVLNELALGALHRYRTNGQQVADLNLAVQYWLEALRLPSSNSPDRLDWLNNLAIGLLDRYALTGDLTDLNAAISHFQQAVEAPPPNSPDWLRYLSNLGSGLADRYTRTGNLADLDAAIAHFQQAVQATPSNSLDQPMYLNNLGGRTARSLHAHRGFDRSRCCHFSLLASS